MPSRYLTSRAIESSRLKPHRGFLAAAIVLYPKDRMPTTNALLAVASKNGLMLLLSIELTHSRRAASVSRVEGF
jgi:hypothetical protein